MPFACVLFRVENIPTPLRATIVYTAPVSTHNSLMMSVSIGRSYISNVCKLGAGSSHGHCCSFTAEQELGWAAGQHQAPQREDSRAAGQIILGLF